MMNFKKILFSFVIVFAITQTTESMFFDENETEEDQIFSLIRQADFAQLMMYLYTNHPDLNNIFSKHDRTPLQEAVNLYNINFKRKEKKENLKKIVKLFLQNGANLKATPRSHKSPVELNEDLFTEIFNTEMSWDAYLFSLHNQLSS